jgi:uncharacterized protein with PQ loop repeat
MFAQLLGTVATVYGVLGALKALLQTRQMLAHRTSRGVSARFLASYTGGYAIWLAYGLSTGSLPLIVVDTVGLLCGGLTLAVALSLRGSCGYGGGSRAVCVRDNLGTALRVRFQSSGTRSEGDEAVEHAHSAMSWAPDTASVRSPMANNPAWMAGPAAGVALRPASLRP